LPSRFKRERLLIIGCGDVGQRVVRVQRHVQVVALTSSPERVAALRAQGVTPVVGNLDAPASLQRLAGWATRVLHLAPPPLQGSTDPRTLALTRMLMRRSAPRSLVYGSTSGVYGDCAGAWVDEAVAALEGMENVTLRARCMAAGVYDHGYVLADEKVADHTPGDGRPKHRLWRIRAGRILTATGAIERPISFAGNDIPGVMLAASVRDYVVNWAVSPGDRTVVVTNNDDGYRTAITLKEAGLAVPAIIDARANPSGDLVAKARALLVVGSSLPSSRAFATCARRAPWGCRRRC
jgi:hypothetical protein